MYLFNEKDLKNYLNNDFVYETVSKKSDFFGCSYNQWLLKSPQKRYIFSRIYGDLIESTGKKVLDIGGGLSNYSQIFDSIHDYLLIDSLDHDNLVEVHMATDKDYGIPINKILDDWYYYNTEKVWDVIIANDIFPNVDQRLGIFLDKFLPVCKEIRMSLTFYEGKFYRAKRIDADEVFTVLMWDESILFYFLEKYMNKIFDYNPSGSCSYDNQSIFDNGRQVKYVIFKGKFFEE